MAAVKNSTGRTLALSKEEKEELRRNTKGVKKTDGSSEGGPRNCILYRDTLIGAEFSSYECLLGNKVEDMNEEDDENSKEKDLVNVEEGIITISFSKEEKQRIRNTWGKKPLPSSYLLVDLGYGYFVVKLSFIEDYEMVVKGGLWFINGFFLTMRRWLPNFRESEASFNLVAVWVWLPKLLLEYYNLVMHT
ncbi:hypothetical protein Golob_011501 [Gossypium lobatum]|uniref:DUF4283 domain-containing protein n=1 Tax=Gossypium lobatum TaxID=34289 RepID=A0A7J8MPN9_9ROSI|nr:hypothetical protein [Gossypium lobatum]